MVPASAKLRLQQCSAHAAALVRADRAERP